jgi:hypothetical protein
MSRLRLRRPSPALVLSTIALIVALTGSAMAAGLINGNAIKKQTIGGGKLKKNTLTGFQINNQKIGSVPSANRALNTHWAVVDNPAGAGNASLARASDAGVTATESGGAVIVVFPVSVAGCADVAARNNSGSQTPQPGFAQTNVSPANPNALEVRTRDQAGNNVDGDFHLLVICP